MFESVNTALSAKEMYPEDLKEIEIINLDRLQGVFLLLDWELNKCLVHSLHLKSIIPPHHQLLLYQIA
jgi:hypothetical protein